MPELGAIQIGAMSSMESPSVIYEYAVGNRPSVQAEKYRLQNSEKNLLLARSARYPQISLGASYGTSYFYMFGNENKVLNAGFGNQFRNHGSEEVGLNVSIPIFNRMATRNNIRSARIAIRNQELALAAAPALAGQNAAVFSVGSDGTDGPTDAAGGYADGDTAAALAAAGWNVFDTLQNNDAYHALQAVDGLIITGATGTNVNDVAVVLIGGEVQADA